MRKTNYTVGLKNNNNKKEKENKSKKRDKKWKLIACGFHFSCKKRIS